MYRIGRQFDFDAAHRLERLPAEHKCHRLHGHTYRVEVTVTSPDLDRAEMVADYAQLDPFAAWLRDTLDHRYLNEVLDTDMPTTERVARECYHAVSDLCPDLAIDVVRVWESATTWAEYW